MRSLLRNDAGDSKRATAFCLSLFSFVLVLGCGSPAESKARPDGADTAVSAAAESPDELLYEQLRSGAFQLNAAASSIEETLTAAKAAIGKLPIGSSSREGMEDVVDYVDSAGSGIGDFSEDPPSKDEVAKDFAAFDEKRLKAIGAASDALKDLREALGLLETMAEDANAAVVKTVLGVRSLLAVSIDDLWGAIEALGGQPEATDEPLDP